MKAIGNIAAVLTMTGAIVTASAARARRVSPPPPTVTPHKLSFGKVGGGYVSAPQLVTIANPGDEAIDFLPFATSGQFGISANNCGASLAPGASCQVSVVFRPVGGHKPKATSEKGALSILVSRLPVQKVHLNGIALGALRMFAANVSTVTVYPLSADGDVPPTATVDGGVANFGPVGVAVDSSGNIYVADGEFNTQILIYRAGSNGNAAPIATIAGPSTSLFSPAGIAVDLSGEIYVADTESGTGRILVFSAGANGDVAPIASISGPDTGLALGLSVGMAVDSSGNLYVTNAGGGPDGSGSITVYSPGSNGDTAPIATIAGVNTGLAGPSGMALDPSGNIYVANNGGISVYPAGSNGDVPPSAVIYNESGDADAVAVDPFSNVYVTNDSNSVGIYSITVFSADSFYDAPPTATIEGKRTGLGIPVAIAIGPLAPPR